MKEYKISDIAAILNLSKQMVRYYEQSGVIHPKRVRENNYRVYDAMDYFALAEAIVLSRFHVNIKDIYALKANDYCTELSRCYRNYIDEADKELRYRHLLKSRAKELLARTENAEMNVGHVWIKRIASHRLYPLLRSRDDDYAQIDTPIEIRSFLNSSEILPFGDGVFEIDKDDDRWWLSFHSSYVDELKLPECEEKIDVEEQYCVCVILNMGEIGQFKTSKIQKAIDEIQKMNYSFIGKPRSLLLCRGSLNNQFRRLLEVQVPIRKP